MFYTVLSRQELQCWSYWFQPSVYLAYGVNHARSSWAMLVIFAPPMVNIRSSWRNLDHLWSPWGSLGFHLGCKWASRVSPAPPLGASWDPLVPLLGPTWTISDLLGHLEAPLSSSWFVLGFDGRSRGSIFTPQGRNQNQVDVIFIPRLIRVGWCWIRIRCCNATKYIRL